MPPPYSVLLLEFPIPLDVEIRKTIDFYRRNRLAELHPKKGRTEGRKITETRVPI